jgi:hypothetical protein
VFANSCFEANILTPAAIPIIKTKPITSVLVITDIFNIIEENIRIFLCTLELVARRSTMM